MSSPKQGFYSPLDQSQIEYVHHDLMSVYDSDGEAGPSIRSRGDSSHTEHGAHSGSSRGESNAPTKRSNNPDDLSLGKKVSGQTSENSDAYAPSKIASTTSTATLQHRVRYRIVLKLKPRERALIRDSWAMILNDESASNISSSAKTKQSKLKGTFGMPSHHKSRLEMGHAAQGSAQSNRAENGVRSNAFTSSLFCSQVYWNLLLMAPQVEQMLPSTKHHAVAFGGVLTAAINNLENLDVLDDFFEHLGKRHARILGIEVPHYELMGVAFLKTMQDIFGVHCTVELEKAWSKLYSYLANSILQFGIDPILCIRPEEDILILPVPNLVEATPTTVINLKNSRQADQHSLGVSTLIGDESSRRGQLESARRGQLQSVPNSNPARKSTISTTSMASSTAATAASSKKSRRFDMSKKAQQEKRPEMRRSFAKPSNFDFNKDCVIM
ncbi:uncharacterized protein ZBIST_2348 [Zygosaccharomyces bailii]|nr:uncharacterized protein ZBIST_2348 [Zygosaccharomyces bailii]